MLPFNGSFCSQRHLFGPLLVSCLKKNATETPWCHLFGPNGPKRCHHGVSCRAPRNQKGQWTTTGVGTQCIWNGCQGVMVRVQVQGLVWWGRVRGCISGWRAGETNRGGARSWHEQYKHYEVRMCSQALVTVVHGVLRRENWSEFGKDNSELGPRSRDLIDVQFKHFFSWPFSLPPLGHLYTIIGL